MPSFDRLCGRVAWTLLPIVFIGLLGVHFLSADAADAAELIKLGDSGDGHFIINFSGYTGGPVREWLEKRGFKLQQDATNSSRLGLSINDQALVLEAKRSMSGFILNDSINLADVKRVRINWGINQYPAETSYENKVNNEAVMLYIFFGKDKISSGHMLIPNSPYFIGLFLCQDEKVNFPYKGRYFHTGGRFVCLGKPEPGETISSEFDLDSGFKSYFDKQQTPNITGFGFGVDTSKAGGGGKGEAFIKSIEFFANPRALSSSAVH